MHRVIPQGQILHIEVLLLKRIEIDGFRTAAGPGTILNILLTNDVERSFHPDSSEVDPGELALVD